MCVCECVWKRHLLEPVSTCRDCLEAKCQTLRCFIPCVWHFVVTFCCSSQTVGFIMKSCVDMEACVCVFFFFTFPIRVQSWVGETFMCMCVGLMAIKKPWIMLTLLAKDLFICHRCVCVRVCLCARASSCRASNLTREWVNVIIFPTLTFPAPADRNCVVRKRLNGRDRKRTGDGGETCFRFQRKWTGEKWSVVYQFSVFIGSVWINSEFVLGILLHWQQSFSL